MHPLLTRTRPSPHPAALQDLRGIYEAAWKQPILPIEHLPAYQPLHNASANSMAINTMAR